ncbi:MAG: hypothetical protein QNK33_01750, partial [Bacteroidales bacterium]|nr:hypothetical protein [Bacteroidales bacterium]
MNLKKFSSVVLFITLSLFGLAQTVDMSLFQGMKPRNIGPAGMSGRVTAIAVHPQNIEHFYIGTASGGLWETRSGGIQFEPIFDNQKVASIGALAIDPQRPDVIWVGTGEGNPRNSLTGGYGLYKSIDAGKTWQLVGLEATRHIHRILINPNNSDEVYVGAIGSPWAPNKERGVYKTSNGGLSWEQILYANETTGVADMVMDPNNPDKILVAMWNHQRWPWFFNSGGEGSGIYMTSDGGDNFKKLKEGLPAKIGRVGLAIAKSNSEYIYAYVESETNAIYRSEDGGATWKIRGEKDIGSRPFYYAEIYVDPANENRIFTLFSGINMSEDGALTFPHRIGQSVHLDHHAWWINPNNPKHMIDGNDGGMAITYNQGKTWRHITNLPVGQFYHISVDMETPYNIYGGMQDNGSWRGPAYTWYSGGIINEFWDFLIGGDGFDALPVPNDARYCYAQSQGGSLRRVDLLSGEGKSIKPRTENRDERLRFNWNAGIAQDPFDDNTIYFGSQFIHKSTDRGDNWVRISPDLTSNDPEKQKQRQSGGLTIDATGAENFCTILAITPSLKEKNVIWASSDDGKIHVTLDSGENWKEVGQNIKDMPKNAWVSQIKVSAFNKEEAFAVVNNYRQGDYSAYLFHTENYGKTWERMIDDNDVWGYMLSFVQDPIEEKLMFAGTEYGLYVSFDKGEVWNKWSEGYPTVSTYDMVIHPREHDLVIGTFGRSIWVLDDIRPLRAFATKGSAMLSEDLVIFDSPLSINAQTKNLPGYYYRADAMYMGTNRRNAAPITFYAKEASEDKLKLEILNSDNVLIKKLEADIKKGFNRVYWNYDMEAPAMPGIIPRENQPSNRNMFRYRRGATVLPGKYKLSSSIGDTQSEASLEINSDPRMPEPNFEAVKENLKRGKEIEPIVIAYNEQYKKFSDMRSKITKSKDMISKEMDFADDHKKAYDTVYKEYNRINRLLTNRREGLGQRMNGLNTLYSAKDKLTATE